MGRIIRGAALIVVLACVAGTLWWFLLARGQEAAIAQWFEGRRAAGWQAEHGAISVAGFPLRLDRRIAQIALADPGTGWSWRLPEVAVTGEALSPNQFDMTLPARHEIAVPGERVEITHTVFTASARLAADPRLEWQEGGAMASGIRAAAQSGWSASADSLDLSLTRRAPESAPPNSYALSLVARTVVLPKPVIERIDPTGFLQPEVQELTVRGTAALDAPLDRLALEDGQLALRAATIRQISLNWGDLSLEARGRFDVDPNGYPAGEIDLTLVNWRQMIAIAREAGALNPSLVDAAEQALEFIARLRGGSDRLDVPLGLSGGKIRIGPVAIADAPRLAPPR